MLNQQTLWSVPAQADRNVTVGVHRVRECPKGADGTWGMWCLGEGTGGSGSAGVGVVTGVLRRLALVMAVVIGVPVGAGTVWAADVLVGFTSDTYTITEGTTGTESGLTIHYSRAMTTTDEDNGATVTIKLEPDPNSTGATTDDFSVADYEENDYDENIDIDNAYDFYLPPGANAVFPVDFVEDADASGETFLISIVYEEDDDGTGTYLGGADTFAKPAGGNATYYTSAVITVNSAAESVETVMPITVTLPDMAITGTEGTTVMVPVTLSRGFDGTSGDQFTVLVTPLGGAGLQAGATVGDYIIDVGTEGHVNHAGDGEVHFLPPAGVTEMNFALELRDDSLWEHGEGIRITFDPDDPLWDDIFQAGTPNSVDVNITDSTTRPTLGMAASVPGVTESTGGGVTTADFYWTDNWPDTAPSVGAGSVGKIPSTYKVRYTISATSTATRAADSSSGDYYISGPTSFSPLSAVLEHNIQPLQAGGDQSAAAPRTTITVNDTAGDQGERTVIVTGQLLDPGGNVVPGFESFGPVTINIIDHLIVTLTSVDAMVPESDASETDVNTTWRVALNAAPAAVLNLQVTKTGSLADDEYTLPMDQFVSFAAAAGDTSQDITVPVTGDDILEENETLTLAIDSSATGFPSAATVASNAASARTVTINDNDTTAFTVERVGAGEVTDGSDVTFRITMSGAIEPSIDLMWQVQSGGDTSPQDFNLNVATFPSGTVTFPADSTAGTTQEFTVSVMDFAGSGDGESAEAFTVGLSIPGSNYGGRATIGTPGTASATIAQDARIPVTLTATPSSIAEGEGVVDVLVTASVPANVSGGALTITLSEASTGTANEDDFTLVGHVANAGTSTEMQMTGMPTITIDDDSSSSTPQWMQLEVPLGVANEAAEELVFTATVSGNILYATASELTIAIPTAQPVADESRIARKQFRLAANGPEVLTWGVDVRIGSASSRNYSIGSETRRLSRVDAFVDGSIVRFEFDQKLPDDANKIMRVTTGGVTTALDFGDVTESLPIDSDYPDREWVYGWDSTVTLPTITLNTWFTAELVQVDVTPRYPPGTAIANQQWYPGEAVELAFPTPTIGNLPFSRFSLNKVPPGLSFVEDGDPLPVGVTYDGERPVLLGTPARSWPTQGILYEVQDADLDDVELNFMAGIATLPPSGLQLTRGQNRFTLSWTAPVVDTASDDVNVSSYRIERRIGTGTFMALSAEPTSTNHTDADSALASAGDGTEVTYRVSAISDGGTSRASNEVTGTVSANPLTGASAVSDLTATASTTNPQEVNLSWSTPTVPTEVTLANFAVRRTTIASNPTDDQWTVVTTTVQLNSSDPQTYTDSDNRLRGGIIYYYQVALVTDEGDQGEWSSTSSGATTVAAVAPGQLAVPTVTGGYTRITIDWEPLALDGGSDIAGYLVQVSEDGTTGWTSLLDDPGDTYTVTGSTTTEYVHAGLEDNVTRHYQVRATNGVDDGPFSDSASAATLPRTAINFTADSATVTLMEGTDSMAATQTITVERASGISGSFDFPLRRTYTGGATAGDFGDLAADADVELLSETDGDGTFLLTVAGVNVTFDVVATDDRNWDPGEGVTYELDEDHADWPEQFSAGVRGILTVTVTDDENPPTITLRASLPGLAEAGGATTATVSAIVDYAAPKGFLEVPHTLVLDLTGGTATLGASEDFTNTVTEIPLPAGGSPPPATTLLTVVSDSDTEQLETIDVAGAVQTTGGDAVAAVTVAGTEVTIVDVLTASVSFDSTTPLSEPSSGNAFTVRLSATPTAEFPLTVSVSGDVTTSDHANLSPETFTFAANDAMITRAGTIDIADDEVAEVDETLTLTLALTSGGTLPAGATIDTTESITVADADRVTASIGLATLADDTVQAAEVVEGGTFAFEVTLSRAVDTMVTVPWSIELLQPLEDLDFGASPGTSGNVTFIADETEANPTATVTLSLAADTADSETNEPFTVDLGPAIKSELGDRVTVADPPENTLTGTIVEPDRIGPTVEIAEPPARVNGTFTLTITFNEDIDFANFDRSDITVTNGRTFSPEPMPADQLRVFTVRISPENERRQDLNEGDEITVQIVAGDVPDTSERMNLNSPSNIVRTIFDSTSPTPTLSSSPGARVRDDFVLTVDFGEVVANFTAAGIGIGITNVPETPAVQLGDDFTSADGGQTYTVTVDLPDTTEPTVTFDIDAEAATDIAGNLSEAAESLVVTVDRTAPVPTVSNEPTGSITEPSFNIQLDFMEVVTGLGRDDFTGDNLTVTSVTPAATPNSYTVNLTVGVSGPLALDLNASAVTDEAGNMSAAIDNLFTGTAALTVLTVSVADPGAVGATFIVTVTFGEAVMGFGDAATDISIAPSSAAAGPPVSSAVAGEENRVFTVPITATVEEELTISIPRDVATATSDGKSNAASVPLMVTPDLTPPVGRITPDPAGRPVNADFSVTITFDEPVTGFEAGDMELGGVSEGAEVRNFEAVTAGMNYTANVTLPDDDGTLTLTIAADALTDAVGNSPAADITLSVMADATPPTVQFVPPTPTGPVNEDFMVGIRFSEPIDADSFDVDRITFKAGRGRRGELTPVVAGREYTLAVFAPAASGPVDITVGAGTVTDAATNPNVEFTGTVIVDNTRPLPELSANIASPLNRDFVLTIDFGESVTGFTAADITIASDPDTATASLANDFAPTAGSQTYTVTVDVPETDAVLTINVAEDVAEDGLGNRSRAATPFMVTVDRTPPTVTVSNAPATAVTEPFTIQLDFAEVVTGFTGLAANHFDLTNLVVTDVSPTPSTPMSYAVSLAPIATGPIALDLNADAVRDAASNGNLLMADLFTGTAEVTGLTTFITAPPRVGATFDIIVTFGEAVTGFDGADDITIVPSTAASASVPVASTATGEENRVFTVGITATEETELTISIAAGTALAAEDSEPNLASLATVRTPDLTPPSGRITTTRRVVNDAFEIDITFTEAVTGFAASDISLSRARGARVTGFEAGTPVGEQYSATITLPDADGFVIVTIPAGAVTDGVGLENAAISTSVRVDTTPPVVVRLFSRAPATVVDEFEVEVWLSERVPEFAADDLQVTNGSAEAPVAADFRPIFIVKIVPTVDGTVTVRVPAEAVRDYAGNRNVVPSRDTVLRTAALQPAPTRPTGLRAFSEQRAVVLRWTAPAVAADGSTGFATRYRIQSSATGRPGSWSDLVARTADDATSYRHADLGDNVTMYYRVYAINVNGSSPQPSNVVVAVTPMPVDIDADGRVTADDGLAYLHVLLGLPPDPAVRRTLLAPYLPAHIDQDNVAAVDAAIEDLIAQRERMRLSLVDVNGDGTQNVVDALLIYHVKAFPELVGDGRAGSGFDRYRQILIRPYLNLTGAPTAEQIEQAINDVISTGRGL